MTTQVCPGFETLIHDVQNNIRMIEKGRVFVIMDKS